MADKTKKVTKKKTMAEPKAWLITINRQSFNYRDPYYHVRDTSRKSAILRAIEWHYQKYPTQEIDSLSVVVDPSDHHFVPDGEESEAA